MRRVIQYLPVLALTMGPCAAYLTWAITRRKPIHTCAAVALNVALWTLGPAWVAYAAAHLL